MTEISAILPLLLLPGVALLIVSTSTRYANLHEEIHRLQDHPHEILGDHLQRRAYLFRNALVGLYLCVCVFALASLIGVILELLKFHPAWMIVALTSLGCIALLYAASQLVMESYLSLEVITHHIQDIGGNKHEKI